MTFSRCRTLVGVTLVALGTTATVAQAADQGQQQLTVKISPAKAGTKNKAAGAGIHVTIRDTAATPATTQTTTISFGKGVSFNNTKFPTCAVATIDRAKSVAKCPKGSIVGKGTARAIGQLAGTAVPESLTVTAVNAPRNTLALFVKGETPLTIAGTLTGKLSKAGGKYANKLTVTIPSYLREVLPGTFAPLVMFDVTVKATATVKQGGKSVKVPYVQTTGCSGGSWPFLGAFTYDQGAPNPVGPSSSTTTAACK
ncbi:MAG: hypothetical protein JWQ48_442 [Conexibacter sp.]|jgi:hypothetical protein|nr:hypothetical protein [Conexibacter sp.]